MFFNLFKKSEKPDTTTPTPDEAPVAAADAESVPAEPTVVEPPSTIARVETATLGSS